MKESGVPAYCSCCFQQDSNLRHVDFEAAYDGPVIPGTPEPVPVDDLVLCEKCLTAAFAILDPQGVNIENQRLMGVIEGLLEENKEKDAMIQRLGMTTSELVEHPIQRQGGGTQHFAGVPEDVRKELAKRKKARKVNQERQKEKVA